LLAFSQYLLLQTSTSVILELSKKDTSLVLKWLLIFDLSSSAGHRVNDGIPQEPFSVPYMKVDEVNEDIVQQGRDTHGPV